MLRSLVKSGGSDGSQPSQPSKCLCAACCKGPNPSCRVNWGVTIFVRTTAADRELIYFYVRAWQRDHWPESVRRLHAKNLLVRMRAWVRRTFWIWAVEIGHFPSGLESSSDEEDNVSARWSEVDDDQLEAFEERCMRVDGVHRPLTTAYRVDEVMQEWLDRQHDPRLPMDWP